MSTCVLLTGMLCDERIVAPQRQALASDHVTVVVNLQDCRMAHAVDRVRRTAGGPCHLVGFSLGGIVAMECAVRHPESVDRLVLIATNAGPPREPQRTAWRRWRELVGDGAFATAVSEINRAMLGSLSSPYVPLAAAMADAVGESGFMRQLQLQEDRGDLRPRLGQVRAPTTVICGERDPLCPPSMAERIRSEIPDAELHTLSDTGHLAPLERPRDINEILTSFLDGARHANHAM